MCKMRWVHGWSEDEFGFWNHFGSQAATYGEQQSLPTTCIICALLSYYRPRVLYCGSTAMFQEGHDVSDCLQDSLRCMKHVVWRVNTVRGFDRQAILLRKYNILRKVIKYLIIISFQICNFKPYKFL